MTLCYHASNMEQPNLEFATSTSHIRKDLLHKGSQVMLFISGVSLFMALVMVVWFTALPSTARATYRPGFPSSAEAQDSVFGQHKPKVGIVSGHAGYDSGAVCPDGLTEAEINAQVAQEVIKLLNQRDIETDLLAEFDSRLNGYRADALVSIHADSCNVPGATGFKVARVTLSAIPEAEDHLVTCLISEYAEVTQLPEHSASITDGMTDYHAFREIASYTPGAIIETGFMLDDRFMLEHNPKLVARGIASGILCFLQSSDNG